MNNVEMVNVGRIKIAILGTPGSGKRTYLSLLYGHLVAKQMIRYIELKNVKHIREHLDLFRLSKVQVTDRMISQNSVKRVFDFLFFNKPLVIRSQDLINSLEFEVPLYEKPKKFYTITIIIDYFEPLYEISEHIHNILSITDVDAESSDIKEIWQQIVHVLKKRAEQGDKWAENALKLLNYYTELDGLILFIDPNPKNILSNIFTLSTILYLLLARIKRKPAIEIIFSKAIYYGLFKKENLSDIENDLEDYKKLSFDKALWNLMEKYTYLMFLIQSLLCKEKRIKFAGAFYYDAFANIVKGSEISDDRHQYIESFNLLMPIYHLGHVIKNKKSPIDYKKVIKEICN